MKKRGQFKTSDEVQSVLKASTIVEGSMCWTLALPPAQLDRKLYLEVNKVLQGVGGAWDKKARVHCFDSDPRPAIILAVCTGVAMDAQKAFQSFYTPPSLARRVVELAEIEPRHLMLEPSAGEGALVLAAQEHANLPLANVRACELNTKAAAVLQEKRVNTYIGNFMDCTCPSNEFPFLFDRVIMNPPFNGQEDIDHVTHALKFLKPGGILVAVMSPSQKFRTNKKTKAFRALLNDNTSTRHEVDAGVFKESGTSIATVIVKILKK